MKKKFLIIVSSILIIACSDDFLDIKPENKIESGNFFVTQADAEASVNSIYSNLRSFNLAAFPTLIFSIASDDAIKGSTPGDAAFFNDIANFSFTPSLQIINDYWVGQWRGVNLTNQSITHIPGIEMDEAIKIRLLAEAHFLRALHYFNLVRAYGGVPIFDGLPADKNYNIPRKSKQEVYDFIIADLLFAEEHLPSFYGEPNIGRATQGAAQSYLAKAYLYLGDLTQVLNYTNKVINSGQYSLFPDFNAMYRIPNENSVESIFEVQCTLISGDLFNSNSEFSLVQGVRGTAAGWGFNEPTEALYDAYEAGDTRRDGTILSVGQTTVEGDFIPPGFGNLRYNKKSYVPFSELGNTKPGAEQNIRLMRYAEVLLMHAEASLASNPGGALNDVNQIRTRAGLSVAGSVDIQAIREQRRLELAMEGERFFDLIRQGRALEVLGSNGFVSGKNEIFPIPTNAIILSNNILTQNPGY